jgi:3-oxoacyl-(acyl-carrier-protein) synthase
MNRRVVITGLGVVAPNATGIQNFSHALRTGVSGISYDKELEDLQFSCRISGTPKIESELLETVFSEVERRNLQSTGFIYGVLASLEAWNNAGLTIETIAPRWESGIIFGNGSLGVGKFRESIHQIDALQTRRLGSSAVIQTMSSAVSAYVGGKLGLGNCNTSNSSACATGTESIIAAAERIATGKADRILAGSSSDSGPYIWGGFDAMRVCTFKHNEHPEQGSRPLSATAAGFVPAAGAGALVLEALDVALERNAPIYAEILGGHVNSGGQRNGGSMTAPNSTAVIRCIQQALLDAGISAAEIDLINGHLTATTKDSTEIENWIQALGRSGAEFPQIQATKGLIGHTLAASGAIETVAAVLQLNNQFLHPNVNAEDIHPEISSRIANHCIHPTGNIQKLDVVAKASFGFGDVNACLILKKYKNDTD